MELDAHPEFDARIDAFLTSLAAVEAFIGRGEPRAARARFEILLDEIQEFSDEIAIPVNSMVVGAQMGFMSGGKLIRGRIPAALIGAGLGWLAGQANLVDKRKTLHRLLERVAITATALDRLETEVAAS